MAPSTPDLTPRREWPHPPRDPGPRCPGSGVHGPAHLLQPFHAAGRCLVASLVDPCARGETTGRQARPGFWALRARGRECRKGVPLGCSVLIPRRLSRLLAECRAWNLEREGERAGRALSGRGPGLGCPARWAGRRVPDGAGPRLSIRSAGEASVLRTRRWESGRPHLFLSHCSLAGKEMTAGVSHPGALTPALRCVCLQARGLSLPPASGLAQCWPLSHSPSAYCPLCAPPLIFREGRTQRDLVMPL